MYLINESFHFFFLISNSTISIRINRIKNVNTAAVMPIFEIAVLIKNKEIKKKSANSCRLQTWFILILKESFVNMGYPIILTNKTIRVIAAQNCPESIKKLSIKCKTIIHFINNKIILVKNIDLTAISTIKEREIQESLNLAKWIF
ncbi:hypothetical protein BpHYR1_024043 [Brachionus plicatilis]|uniref:Uncharacterized protein n=1 Tax=Brachionus plicatilis TaxID=10195 RepID=A0A3M7SJ83_BRAPC|nr:hypothetical protein BpHYR1_024043 [Brachionus plicatilis]